MTAISEMVILHEKFKYDVCILYNGDKMKSDQLKKDVVDGAAPGQSDAAQVEILEYPYLLTLEVGDIADHISVARDDIHDVHVGSEIQPAHIGHEEVGDFQNGVSYIRDYYVVVQHGRPILVVHEEGGYNYGAEYQRNGGWKEVRFHSLAEVEASALDLYEEGGEYDE